MNKQPLLATLLVMALGGCKVQQVPLDIAPAPAPLHSEFQSVDDGASFYGPFLAATQAQQDSQYIKSADYFLQALDADPGSKYVADRAFFQLLYGGNTEKAASLAKRLVEGGLEDDDDLIRLMYVLEAFKKADWKAVRARLGSGTATGFGFIVTPLIKAWSYAGEGNMLAAKDALAPLLHDVRLKSIAEEHTAYLFDYLERYDDAEEQYVILTSANPPVSLQPAVAYAHMLYKTGNRARARGFLTEQINRFNNHNFLLREGSLLAKGGQPSQIAASPNGAAGMVFFRLATEFAQGKSTQAAVLYARIASYLTPNVSDIYFLLGELLQQDGDYDASAAAYNLVPLDSPMRKLSDLRRIDSFRLGGRSEIAEKLIRNRLRHSPNELSMLLSLADVLQRREAYTEAIIYYDKAVSNLKRPSEGDWRVFFDRAVAYEGMDNWPAAEKDLLRALELSPEQPAVLNYLGYTWIDKGQHFDRAKRMIEKAAAARPEDGFITDSLGWAYYLTGDYEAAVEILEKAVRLEPTDVTINDHLGDAYWRVGRKIEARFQWQHAIDAGAAGQDLAALLRKLETGIQDNSQDG